MIDLTSRWPLGLNRKTWPDRAVTLVMVLFALVFIDAWASQTLQAWPDIWRAPFFFITDFGLSDWILIPSALLFALAAIALRLPLGRYRRAVYEFGLVAAFIFIGVGVPGLLSNLIKRLIGRARPDHYLDAGAFHFQHVINAWDFQSFPSGHSTTAMAFALVVGFMLPRLFPAILVISLMTGLSRVVTGMHYPTDVVGGFALGLIGAYAVRNAFARHRWLFANRADGSVRFRGVPNLKRLLRRWFHRAAV